MTDERRDDELADLFGGLWQEPGSEQPAADEPETQPALQSEAAGQADDELTDWFGPAPEAAPQPEPPTPPFTAPEPPPVTEEPVVAEPADAELTDWFGVGSQPTSSAVPEASAALEPQPEPEPATEIEPQAVAGDEDPWAWFSPLPSQVERAGAEQAAGDAPGGPEAPAVPDAIGSEPQPDSSEAVPADAVADDLADLADLYDEAADEAPAPPQPEPQTTGEAPMVDPEPEAAPSESVPAEDPADAELAAWLAGDDPAPAPTQAPADASDLFADIDVVGADESSDEPTREIDPELMSIGELDRAEDVALDLDTPEADLGAHLERLASAGEIEAPEVAVIAAPTVERETEAERAKRTRAPGPLSRAMTALGNFWHGTLGWRAHPDRPGYVLGKMGLRFGLFFIVPIAIVTFVSLPALGSAFPSQPFDASGSTLTWGRGLVEYLPRDEKVQLATGEGMSSRLDRELRGLYYDFWEAYLIGLANGDISAVEPLVSGSLWDKLSADADQLITGGFSYRVSPTLYDPRLLTFSDATPASNPEFVTGGQAVSFRLWVVDADGNVSLGPIGYIGTSVEFSRSADVWRISSLRYLPAPDDVNVDPELPDGVDPSQVEELPPPPDFVSNPDLTPIVSNSPADPESEGGVDPNSRSEGSSVEPSVPGDVSGPIDPGAATDPIVVPGSGG